MAPRARKGLKRIDTALDALRPMGFNDAIIRKTARGLLKEYGGDDGWQFIEEYSYKLLIESILEEQEKTVEKDADVESSVSECTPKDAPVQDEPEMLHIQSPMDVEKSHCSKGEVSENKLKLQTPSSETHSSSTHSSLLEASTQNIQSGDDTSCLSSSLEKHDAPAMKRRRPIYGWISSDDEDDFV